MTEYEASSAGGAAAGKEPHAELAAFPINEPGMNFISADFDLIMVNRTNERIYGKPVASLLGKKCYREFERRLEPCPHCPGRVALATGETAESDAIGRHGDGTRLYARIRAHPVLGPDNVPTGFIEVVEDLTEQRRAESLAAIETDFQTALLSAKNVHRALREVIESALRVECIEWGCVFLVHRATGEHELVHQRGLSASQLDHLRAVSLRLIQPEPSLLPNGSPVFDLVPILHRGILVANLIVGGSACNVIPSPLKAGVRSLGVLAGNAISRIFAEQSRGDAVADLEAFIAIAPIATWVIDAEERITMWNKAAERVLGWQASDMLGNVPRFAGAHAEQQPTKITCKDGRTIDVRLVSAPFRDVVGNASTTLIMAEVLCQPAAAQPSADATAAQAGSPDSGAAPPAIRVLVLDAGESWGGDLSAILTTLGDPPARCRSTLEAAALLTEAEFRNEPFSLGVVSMIYEDGRSGLDQKAALRGLGFSAPVMVSSDVGVRGHEHYGIASVITRPYAADAVAEAVDQALLQRR